MKDSYKKIIRELVSFGTRQNDAALAASAYIQNTFRLASVDLTVQEYVVDLPQWGACSLVVDGVDIECLPTSLTSGKLTASDPITTSLISSKQFLNTPHINVNEQCDVISRANFSFAPSLAINRKDVERVANAKMLVGEVCVQKTPQKTEQILVGNCKNPKRIIFSHFDSIGTGGVDDASGTALCMQIILNDKNVLDENLFVFDGNEELSYDAPTYWGKGYRNFEETYQSIMNTCEKIIVVDCVGYEKTQIITEGDILPLAFPIQGAGKYAHKISLVASDYDRLMSVYHSDNDDGSLIQEGFFEEAEGVVKGLIS